MQLWRYSGVFLILTGVIHNLIGVFLGWEYILAVVNDGIWNTMEVQVAPGAEHTRAELLWFLMLGFAFIMLGAKFHEEIKNKQRPLSSVWGWLLLIQGLLIVILYPQTGAWLFIPQGLVIIYANADRHGKRHARAISPR